MAATDDAAKHELWPHYQKVVTRIGGERGWAPPTKAAFEASCGPAGSLYVGSPETVARKIAATAKILGLSRFSMKYSHGELAHGTLMTSIELYGTKVMPRVHELLAG